MTNRMKGVLGVGVFLLTGVEQLLAALYGRFFEQPIDPIVLMGIGTLLYGVEKFKSPDIDVAIFSRFIKFIVICVVLSVISVLLSKGAAYLVAHHVTTLSMNGFVATVRSLSSLSWGLATIAALCSLREVFFMK